MNMTKITEEYEDGVEIETDAKHITIHTKHGEINLFMGNNPSKFKKADGTRMVILRGE
jgi:hypothetical protein